MPTGHNWRLSEKHNKKSMAAIKENPRQKMISILYLVLLGMIALNVSSSVLDAFRKIKQSLETSTKHVQNSINNTFLAFEQTKLKDEPERARVVYAKALEARKHSDELNKYINDIKNMMIKEGGGMDAGTEDVSKRDNEDISYRLMINKKRGSELKKRINDTRDKFYSLLSAHDREGLVLPLEASDPPKRGGIKTSWELSNFGDGIPLTAALTTLAKIQADLKNSESEVVKKILGQMDKAVVNLDQFAAVAVAPTSYVIQGQPYTAEVFLTASDSKSNPEISVNGQPVSIKDGRGVYLANTSAEGTHTWTGTIKVMQTDGTVKEYVTPPQTYQVARPSAVVSPDKMNVFYIGVPNPVSVSAPGIPKEKIRVNISGGSISGSNGKYNVSVSKPGEARVVVSAEVAPGKVQTLSNTEFRVKRIPDPKVKFGGKSSGRISTVAMKSQNKIFPVMEGFDFDAKFSIQRFSMIIMKPRADAVVLSTSGNTLSGAMQSAMNNITGGTRVIFDNIIATGPDGMKRELDAVNLLAE
jgi:gliding motility-associated protein GldM